MNVSCAAPPEYVRRRSAISGQAAGPRRPPTDIEYTEIEHRTWEHVVHALVPVWARHGALVANEGLDRLGLDRTRIPQLRDITGRLSAWSGFSFEAVPGLVGKEQFFAALAERRFLSTQYVRWEGSPLYTPEPDVIHEVVGHAHLLTNGDLAELHRLAGDAMKRVTDPASRQFVADVFWFSGEFGVVREAGSWKAYGAGLLSSFGELGWFATGATVTPLDIAEMGTVPYDISTYQPRLFGASSIDEVLDVVGGFFASCTDASIARLRRGAERRKVTT